MMLLQLLHWRSNHVINDINGPLKTIVYITELANQPVTYVNFILSTTFFQLLLLSVLCTYFSYRSVSSCLHLSSFLNAAVEHIGYSSFTTLSWDLKMSSNTYLSCHVYQVFIFIYIHSSALFSVPSTVNQDYISMLPCLISSTDVLLFAVHCQHTQEQH